MRTIEEQIEEAREELHVAARALEGRGIVAESVADAGSRLWERATKRLATLEAVRDGRMIEVYATVSVDADRAWASYGHHVHEPLSSDVREGAAHESGDALTILRGYATVPSDEVAEVEAES